MLKHLMEDIVFNFGEYWIIDDIPIKFCYWNLDQEICFHSFQIGCYVSKNSQTSQLCNRLAVKRDTFYVFNHLDFTIVYHNQGKFANRIVAVKVQVNRSVQSVYYHCWFFDCFIVWIQKIVNEIQNQWCSNQHQKMWKFHLHIVSNS